MKAAKYAVRRANDSERGRWVIHVNGFPHRVVATDFLTRWGATFCASRWLRQEEKANKSYPV